jgi:hypothetical protein
MENRETPEQLRIKELELQNYTLSEEKKQLELINLKLGYSTRLMSEFHLTQDDKEKIANSLDIASTPSDIETVYNQYYKLLHNKNLKDGMEEFQMSEDFKSNLVSYLSVAFGENPITSIEDKIIILKEYFEFENKIRSTPDANHRQAMTDKLLQSRAGTLEALNGIIDIINNFNKES